MRKWCGEKKVVNGGVRLHSRATTFICSTSLSKAARLDEIVVVVVAGGNFELFQSIAACFPLVTHQDLRRTSTINNVAAFAVS